jgi:hypothetical protein
VSNETPTHAGWRFRFRRSKSSCHWSGRRSDACACPAHSRKSILILSFP